VSAEGIGEALVAFTRTEILSTKSLLMEVVRLLLDRGARLDVKDRSGYTALYWAAAKGHAGVVALLLRRGAQVRHASLSYTVRSLCNFFYESCLQCGTCVQATLRQQGGWTALMVAAFKGYGPVVKLLLQHGPVRQAVNDESW
jgi:ankyrin repeat protein